MDSSCCISLPDPNLRLFSLPSWCRYRNFSLCFGVLWSSPTRAPPLTFVSNLCQWCWYANTCERGYYKSSSKACGEKYIFTLIIWNFSSCKSDGFQWWFIYFEGISNRGRCNLFCRIFEVTILPLCVWYKQIKLNFSWI